jgi:hypothetical protein
VDVFYCMAGIAVDGCTCENMICMTILASHIDVLPCQFKSRQVVIEFGWAPTVFRMAGSTIASKTAIVWVLRLVAGVAVLRGCLKIYQGAGIGVTINAVDVGMFPS